MAKPVRLDKYLCDMGRGTRSQVKDAAKLGRIQVNGCVEKKTDRKIDPDSDEVLFDGCPAVYHEKEYYMLYKPQGVVSATRDNLHRTVLDLLGGEKRSDLFPVGRLDIDTEGLLLLTNDGDLAHRLLAPGRHVDKQYYVRVEGTLPEDAAAQMAAGMTLADGTSVRPAHLRILGPVSAECTDAANGAGRAASEVVLTIHEGKFHQVKRMFEVMGCRVEYLKRLSMGSLSLDPELAPGQYRTLTQDELRLLKERNDG